jgi:hypothetical protein
MKMLKNVFIQFILRVEKLNFLLFFYTKNFLFKIAIKKVTFATTIALID